MKTLPTIGLAVSLSFFGTSCASILTGSTDKLDITSNPTGATFSTDQGHSGVTPAIIEVPGARNVEFTFSMPGYNQMTMVSMPHTSKWIWGNILFGGLIGIAIDAIGDSAKTHDDVSVTLKPL